MQREVQHNRKKDPLFTYGETIRNNNLNTKVVLVNNEYEVIPLHNNVGTILNAN